MFKIMMKKMDNVETKVDGVKSKVDEAVTMATEAKVAVANVEAAVKTVKADIDKDKTERKEWQAGMEERFAAIEFKDSSEDTRPTEPDIQEKLKEIEVKIAGMSSMDPWAAGWKSTGPTSHGKAGGGGAAWMDGPWMGGKGKGKWDPKKLEQRSRTLKFTNFKRDTPEKAIKDAIKDKLMEVEDKVEEYFAYGKYADAGGARFKTEGDLWTYLTDKTGDLNFGLHGQRIYMSADKIGGDAPREKAIRKLVRTIIEANGGDGNGLKAAGRIYANYRIGYVLWKGERVAEWDDKSGKVKFTEKGQGYEQSFRKLVGE